MSLINQMLKDLEARRANKESADKADPTSGLNAVEETTPKRSFTLSKQMITRIAILGIFGIVMAGLLLVDVVEDVEEVETEKSLRQQALTAEQKAANLEKAEQVDEQRKKSGAPALQEAAQDPFVALIQAETQAAAGVDAQGLPEGATQGSISQDAAIPNVSNADSPDLSVKATGLQPTELQTEPASFKLSTLDRIQVGDVIDNQQTISFVFSGPFQHEFYTDETGRKIGLILDHTKFEQKDLPRLKANSLIQEITLQKKETSLEFLFDVDVGVVLASLETEKKSASPQLVVKLKRTVTNDVDNKALFEKPEELPMIKETKSGEMTRVVKPPTEEELADMRYEVALQDIKLGHMVSAIEKLAFLLEAYPYQQDARKSLIMIYLSRGSLLDAEATLMEGLAYSPDYIPFIVLDARLKIQQGDLKSALSLLRSHSPALKKFPEYYAMQASLEQQIGSQQKAGELYLELLKDDQSVGSWWFGYALTLEASQQRNLAVQAYRRAIKTGNLSPDLTAYAQNRIQVLGD